MRVRLSNGLTVILLPDGLSPVTALSLWVRVGSRCERPEEAGLSHFIEHMLFKGTPRRGVGVLAREAESAGGDINAFTTPDYTSIYLTVKAENVGLGLDLLSDAVLHPKFDPAEVALEREVILEEIHRQDDDPALRVESLLFATCYRRHPYRRPVVGFPRTVRGFEAERVRRFFRRWYRPANMVLALAGPLDPKETLRKVRRLLGRAPSPPGPSLRPPVEPPQRRLRVALRRRRAALVHLDCAFHIPAFAHPDAPALGVLASLLGGGDAARLHRVLKEERGLVHGVGTSALDTADPGLFVVGATLDAPALPDALRGIREVGESLERGEIASEELGRAKLAIESDLLFRRETAQSRAHMAAFFETMGGAWGGEEGFLARVQAVGPQDLRRVVRAYLRPSNLTVAALLPEEAPARLTPEALRRAILGLRLPPLPARRVRERCGTRRICFQNGLVALVRPNGVAPTVAIRAVYLGGSRAEPPTWGGVCRLVSELLVRGSERLRAHEVARRAEALGGSLEPFSGRNSWGLAAEFLSQHLEEGLALVADLLRAPSLSAQEVGKVRRDMLADLRREEEDLGRCAYNLFLQTLYGPHPYGRNVLGTQESLRRLGRREALSFWRRHGLPANLALAVAGEVDPGAAERAIARLLGDWRGHPHRPPRPRPLPPLRGRTASLSMDGGNQTHLVLGFPGAPLKARDRYPLEVLSTLLSSQGGSLFLELRDRRGLAYAVSAFYEPGLDPGPFGIYLAISPGRREEAIRVVEREVERVRRGRVPGEEVERAKEFLLGAFLANRQRNAALAADLAFHERYSLGFEREALYPKEVASVGKRELAEVARRYLRWEERVVAEVGPKRE
ncbi:MAG: M16 family metallopeptidase [Nitrospinota bacterium]